MRAFLRSKSNDIFDVENNKKAYNILKAHHDIENCNGWSVTVTKKQLDVLKHSHFGVFMVNLAKGAMMGPHWNPRSVEVTIVLYGRGMVHVVCPSVANETECKNSRFRVEEGDVFVVPKYYPMVQLSFNNDSFVFMGFTATLKKNSPGYLVGKTSVFRMLDKMVLTKSFNVSNTTMDQVVSAQKGSIILECTSCAEEEEMLMEEEAEKEAEEKEEKVEEKEEEAADEEKEEAEEKKTEEKGEGGRGGGGPQEEEKGEGGGEGRGPREEEQKEEEGARGGGPQEEEQKKEEGGPQKEEEKEEGGKGGPQEEHKEEEIGGGGGGQQGEQKEEGGGGRGQQEEEMGRRQGEAKEKVAKGGEGGGRSGYKTKGGHFVI